MRSDAHHTAPGALLPQSGNTPRLAAYAVHTAAYAAYAVAYGGGLPCGRAAAAIAALPQYAFAVALLPA